MIGEGAVLALLAPGPGWSLEAVAEEGDRLASLAGPTTRSLLAVTIDGEPDLGGEWAAVIDLRGPVGPAAAALAGLGARLGPVIDAGRSGLLVGTARPIFDRTPEPSGTLVQLYYALFRQAGGEQDAFSDHWYTIHAPAVVESPYPRIYHQIHGDPEATAAAAATAGLGVGDIAGVAHETFLSPERLAEGMADTDLDDERADVALFSDPARNRGIVTRPHP